MILGLFQYAAALLLIVATVLYVVSYSNGTLPFMNEQYLALRNDGTLLPTVTPSDESNVDLTPPTQTPVSFSSALDSYSGQGVYTGVYSDDGGHIVRFDLAPLKELKGCKLDVGMGLVKKTDAEGNVSYYDPASGLKDITLALSGTKAINIRDAEGNPLFYDGSAYYRYANGKLMPAEYDPYNMDKGIDYYPSYLAGYDVEYIVFKDQTTGLFGIKEASGAIILRAEFADVYSVSEERIVAVDSDHRLYIYTTDGRVISDGVYRATELTDTNALGCYFYKNGLLRAYTADNKSVLLDVDGNIFDVPSGFDICAYSDGVILLKQIYTDSNDKKVTVYGYMNSNGQWICNPDYNDARPFYEGLAAVQGKNGLWGMIDTDGNVVVPLLFDNISDCKDGVFVAYAQKYGNYVFGKVSG